jgi:hypothetical protein
MITTNLPPTDSSDEAVKLFFNNFYNSYMSFPAEQIDAVVGFFQKRGFDDIAAGATAIVLLQQSRTDGVNVFDLLQTLVGLTSLQLSSVVSNVLNYNRQKNSILGFRQQSNAEFFENRNIIV